MSGAIKLAIIGGTGDLGSGLAHLWAKAGHDVLIGSRAADKAEAKAKELSSACGRPIRGLANVEAARQAEVVIVAVPYGSHAATLKELKDALADKIVVDAVVPLAPPKVSLVQLPPGGCAALDARRILGAGARIASAFHNVGARKLHDGQKADCDVLVFADDKDVRDLVASLAGEIGTRGIPAGPLANSVAAEALTSVLIWINRAHKASGAGLRITGLDA